MDMTDLHAEGRYRRPGTLVLDVRSRREHRTGHVPGSVNVPVHRIERNPRALRPGLAVFERVYVHCSAGPRAKRAGRALERAGMDNVTVIDRAGMKQWAREGFPVEREISPMRDIATGAAAGLVAQLALAGLQRSGSSHEAAASRFGPAFPVAYGLAWGAIYALTRRRLPMASALLGLPFAAAFFLACDGVLAPLLGMSPALHRIPTASSAKELANHVAWTATAELVHPRRRAPAMKLGPVLVLGALVATLLLERRRPLRKERQNHLRRDIRNGSMALMTMSAIALTEKPLVRWAHRKRRGLLPRLGLPAWLGTAAAIVLLDYTLYLWHVLTHKVPLLWRLHRVHHSDLDLSASTALRFHFVEMILSAPWRAAQVALIGVTPRQLSAWQTLTTMAILFHHSNIRLPLALERALSRVIVTPRMHGIHHSVVERETDSNWGTIFSLPDYLHRTVRLDVPQQAIEIGVPALRKGEQVTLPRLIAMPFGRQRLAA